jgi:hypothetical protein
MSQTGSIAREIEKHKRMREGDTHWDSTRRLDNYVRRGVSAAVRAEQSGLFRARSRDTLTPGIRALCPVSGLSIVQVKYTLVEACQSVTAYVWWGE